MSKMHVTVPIAKGDEALKIHEHLPHTPLFDFVQGFFFIDELWLANESWRDIPLLFAKLVIGSDALKRQLKDPYCTIGFSPVLNEKNELTGISVAPIEISQPMEIEEFD